jgi:transcriptional regulator GlxA family with amidase domain
MGKSGLRRMALLVYPLVDVLDVAGPSEVFSAARRAVAAVGGPCDSSYSLEIVAASRELAVETDSSVRLLAHRSYRGLRGSIDTLLVAGGLGAEEAAKDRALLRWLNRMAPRVRRLGSICTGAFVRAAAGLLDGKEATTHRSAIETLRRQYPKVTVRDNRRVVDNGKIVTSAGVSAGIDGALHRVDRLSVRVQASEAAHHMEYRWQVLAEGKE